MVKILTDYSSTNTVIQEQILGSHKKRRKQNTSCGNDGFKSSQRVYQTGHIRNDIIRKDQGEIRSQDTRGDGWDTWKKWKKNAFQNGLKI